MDKDVYIISKVYFENLIESSSRSLVGKAMKRFELSENPADIKLQIKNLIYEELRNIKVLVDSHQRGYELSRWVFTTPKQKEG